MKDPEAPLKATGLVPAGDTEVEVDPDEEPPWGTEEDEVKKPEAVGLLLIPLEGTVVPIAPTSGIPVLEAPVKTSVAVTTVSLAADPVTVATITVVMTDSVLEASEPDPDPVDSFPVDPDPDPVDPVPVGTAPVDSVPVGAAPVYDGAVGLPVSVAVTGQTVV